MQACQSRGLQAGAHLAHAAPGDEVPDDGREEDHGGHQRDGAHAREQHAPALQQRQVRGAWAQDKSAEVRDGLLRRTAPARRQQGRCCMLRQVPVLAPAGGIGTTCLLTARCGSHMQGLRCKCRITAAATTTAHCAHQQPFLHANRLRTWRSSAVTQAPVCAPYTCRATSRMLFENAADPHIH